MIDFRMVSIKKYYKETFFFGNKLKKGKISFISFPGLLLSQLFLDAFFLLCLWLLVPVCPLALVFLFVPPSPFPAIVSLPSVASRSLAASLSITVMEGLPPIASSMAAYHFQDAAVGSPSSVLTPVCGHFRSYRNVQNTKSLILITQFK